MKALLALLLLPLSASAEERLAVAALAAPAELRFTAKGLSEALVKQAAKQQVTVLGPEQVEARLGREKSRQLTECGVSAPCLAALARALGVERVVGGTLDQVDKSYRVALVSADVKSGEPVASWEREVPVASRKLAAEVAEAAGGLLRGLGSGGAAAR
jgi:hypothetical protein